MEAVADDRRRFDFAGLEVLSHDECRRLLATGGVGRVAVPGEPPIVRPVNFAFDEDRIVIRTGAGELWSAACRSVRVTFEADECAKRRPSWLERARQRSAGSASRRRQCARLASASVGAARAVTASSP